MPKERRLSQLLCLPDAQNQILFLNIGEGIQWEESGYIGFYSFANTKTSEILYQIADFLTNWSDDKSRDDWSWKGWSTWSCSKISHSPSIGGIPFSFCFPFSPFSSRLPVWQLCIDCSDGLWSLLIILFELSQWGVLAEVWKKENDSEFLFPGPVSGCLITVDFLNIRNSLLKKFCSASRFWYPLLPLVPMDLWMVAALLILSSGPPNNPLQFPLST
jgi:hypothetical protein